MLNLSGALTRCGRHFEVYLKRKKTANESQNARQRVEHIQAGDAAEAKSLALAMPRNAAYSFSSIKEIR